MNAWAAEAVGPATKNRSSPAPICASAQSMNGPLTPIPASAPAVICAGVSARWAFALAFAVLAAGQRTCRPSRATTTAASAAVEPAIAVREAVPCTSSAMSATAPRTPTTWTSNVTGGDGSGGSRGHSPMDSGRRPVGARSPRHRPDDLEPVHRRPRGARRAQLRGGQGGDGLALRGRLQRDRADRRRRARRVVAGARQQRAAAARDRQHVLAGRQCDGAQRLVLVRVALAPAQRARRAPVDVDRHRAPDRAAHVHPAAAAAPEREALLEAAGGAGSALAGLRIEHPGAGHGLRRNPYPRRPRRGGRVTDARARPGLVDRLLHARAEAPRALARALVQRVVGLDQPRVAHLAPDLVPPRLRDEAVVARRAAVGRVAPADD